jgi:predicted lipid-binding transport protein (Tim44 family)
MMGGGGMMGGWAGGLGGLGGGLGDIGGLLMGFGLMGLVPLLILGVIIWAVVEATRNRGSQNTPPPAVYGQHGLQQYGVQGGQAPYAGPSFPAQSAAPQAGAIAILDERYARGEIDREEYLARKGDLV